MTLPEDCVHRLLGTCLLLDLRLSSAAKLPPALPLKSKLSNSKTLHFSTPLSFHYHCSELPKPFCFSPLSGRLLSSTLHGCSVAQVLPLQHTSACRSPPTAQALCRCVQQQPRCVWHTARLLREQPACLPFPCSHSARLGYDPQSPQRLLCKNEEMGSPQFLLE